MTKVWLAVVAAAGFAASAAAEQAGAGPAPAAPVEAAKPRAPNDRLRVFANAVFTPGSLDFSQSRTFQEYQEGGSLDSDYALESGRGFELGLHYKWKPRLGVMASVALARRDGTLTYSGSYPHPLFLGQPREPSGTDESLSYGETAFHVDFVYTYSSGGLELLLFGGPAYVSARSDLMLRLDKTETYPYDQLGAARVVLEETSGNAFGFSMGAGLDYRFGQTRRFGLAAQVRYTSAKVTLDPGEGPSVDLDAGGLQVAGGLRLYF